MAAGRGTRLRGPRPPQGQKSELEKEVRLISSTRRAVYPGIRGKFLPAEAWPNGNAVPRKRGLSPQSQLHAVKKAMAHVDCRSGRSVSFGPRAAIWSIFSLLHRISVNPSPSSGADDPPAWLDQQKDRLKANPSALVLAALAPFVEADSDAPVAACDQLSAQPPGSTRL